VTPSGSSWNPYGDEPSPGDELAAYSLEDRVAAEKTRALKEPGPSWRQWLYQSAFRGWYALAILIVDVQIVVFWIEVGSTIGLGVTLALALYLEFLLYQILWHRPRSDARPGRPFRRTWLRPAEYGRWTPEAELVRAGVSIYRTEQGPNPEEFL
jgi:hypothetical protein